MVVGKCVQEVVFFGDVGLLIYMLVFCDDLMKLFQVSVGIVCYYCEVVMEECDGIMLWLVLQYIVFGSVQCVSVDYKYGVMDQFLQVSIFDQGEVGNDLVQLLFDSFIDVLYVVDFSDDYQCLVIVWMLLYELCVVSVEGSSGVCDLVVGCWFELMGYLDVS